MKKNDVKAQVATAVRACQEKEGDGHQHPALDAQASGFTDYFILCSGANPRQVQAIADEIDQKLSAAGVEPNTCEGYTQAEWLLMDYVDFVVHIFSENARRFYDLERLWKSAKRVQLSDLEKPARKPAAKQTAAKRAVKPKTAAEGEARAPQARRCLSSTHEDLNVKLRIAWIGRTRSAPIQSLTAEYLKRLSRYAACDAQELTSEAALLKLVEKSTARTQPVLVLLDSRGQQLTSEEIANFLDYHQSHDTQELLFAVGPADGWSDETRAQGQEHPLLREGHAAA